MVSFMPRSLYPSTPFIEGSVGPKGDPDAIEKTVEYFSGTEPWLAVALTVKTLRSTEKS